MHGRPMVEYEMRELFMLLKVKNNPLQHWLDTNGWGIIYAMHDVVFFRIIHVDVVFFFLL
jgi:hypothetical protein